MFPSVFSRFAFLISTLKLTSIENYHVGVWLELISERKNSFWTRDSDGKIERLAIAYAEPELGRSSR